jgi:hypothetical protein
MLHLETISTQSVNASGLSTHLMRENRCCLLLHQNCCVGLILVGYYLLDYYYTKYFKVQITFEAFVLLEVFIGPS